MLTLSNETCVGRAHLRRILLMSLSCLAWPAAAAEHASPWSEPASWQIEEKEVRFMSDGVELAGTLYSPQGVTAGPAVVAVQQNGTTTRDNTLFMQLAETLTAIGHSVFLYDRRGFGESAGSAGRIAFETLARDAVAAKRAIAAVDAVDAGRIGYWGVSQSGWLAMEASTMSNPAFVISVSAPLTTPGRQMEVLAYNYVLAAGHGEAAAEQALSTRRLVMDDFFRGAVSFDVARGALQAVADEAWLEWAFLPTAEELPEDISASSWIDEMDYDPTAAFYGSQAPLLFLLGGEDPDIPVAETLAVIARGETRDNLSVVVLPGADHIMRVPDAPLVGEEANRSRDVSESAEYFLVMGHWLGRLPR